MNTMTTKRKLSSELQTGDIVWSLGLRVQLDRILATHSGDHGTVYAYEGTILNYDELDKSTRYYVGCHRMWIVQGNDNASWTVEDK